MLAGTQAFYMMANQLSLLGLANVPKDARSGSAQHPYVLPLFKLSSTTSKSPASKAAAQGTPATFGNVFETLGVARDQAKTLSAQTDRTRLQVVAFNDTNDLLTWHMPPWYVNTGVNQALYCLHRPVRALDERPASVEDLAQP